MDKTKQQILESYLAAARKEPGISESEIREIFQRRLASVGRADRARRGMASRLNSLLLLGLLLGAGLYLVRWTLHNGSTNEGTKVGDVRPTPPAAKRSPVEEPATSADAPPSEAPAGIAAEHRSPATFGTAPIGSTPHGSSKSNGRETDPKVPTVPAARALQNLNERLGVVASEYWSQRLNSYKMALDQLYTGEDSLELNRLRARYAVLSWQLANDTTDRTARGQELIQVYETAITLSERHPNECNVLCASMVRDFTGYFRQMRDSTDAFIAANALAAGTVREMKRGLDSADSMVALLSRPENKGELEMIHGMITAPMVLFYAGSDLKTLVDQLELSMSVGMMPRNMHSIPGFAMLPEDTTLEAPFPDQASDQTTIRYHLAEQSDTTILRLFDAAGNLAARYDRGNQGIGEQSIRVDLSSLSPGPYLYQLTTTTPQGERVYAKILQVRR